MALQQVEEMIDEDDFKKSRNLLEFIDKNEFNENKK